MLVQMYFYGIDFNEPLNYEREMGAAWSIFVERVW
jgi:hypothetical protein